MAVGIYVREKCICSSFVAPRNYLYNAETKVIQLSYQSSSHSNHSITKGPGSVKTLK